jgi:hypothetical protein
VRDYLPLLRRQRFKPGQCLFRRHQLALFAGDEERPAHRL